MTDRQPEPTTEAGRLRDLLDNRQMPDHAMPAVTLGELRALRLAIETEAASLDVDAAARRLVRAEDTLADIHAAWPVHTGTYDDHLRLQHAAETEVVTAKAALRAILAEKQP